MIDVIRGLPISLLFYWKKPVTDDLVSSRQNARSVIVIRLQNKSSPALEGNENWTQLENNRLITDLHTPEIIQIPIVFRHIESPCLRPAVSSLGACPTPAL